MFDKLEDLLIRFEEIMGELNEPDVTANQERFRALMKEQSDLTPIVEAYREYKKCNQDIEDSLMMLDEENDPDMREMLKEELNSAKTRVSELEEELKILLLPKDPNDEKNVIVEIRAGAGGDEAVLSAGSANASSFSLTGVPEKLKSSITKDPQLNFCVSPSLLQFFIIIVAAIVSPLLGNHDLIHFLSLSLMLRERLSLSPDATSV